MSDDEDFGPPPTDWDLIMEKYPLDPNTNMPQLPEKWFWRTYWIKAGEYNFNPSIALQLRKYHDPAWYRRKNSSKKIREKIWRLESDEKVWVNGLYHYAPIPAEDLPRTILSMAYLIMEDYAIVMAEEEAREKMEKALKALASDFPPGRLEV